MGMGSIKVTNRESNQQGHTTVVTLMRQKDGGLVTPPSLFPQARKIFASVVVVA